MRNLTAYLILLSGLTLPVQAQSSFESSIIGGVEASEGIFEEVAVFESGRGICSGVLIGPRVLLTAAHCAMGHLSIAEIQFTKQTIRGTVETHPLFQSSRSAEHDLALVLLGTPADAIPMASIELETEVSVNWPVTLVGFGCSAPNGGGNAGIKRYGRSKISEVRDGQYISRQADGSAVCFGDSGGPLYANSAEKPDSLSLIGVHVAGNLRDTSYSARLDAAENLKFMLLFAHKHQVDICGLTVDCAPIQYFE